MNLAEFFHMGGYAFYVWTSYAITLVVLLANLWLPWREHRQILKQNARRAERRR